MRASLLPGVGLSACSLCGALGLVLLLAGGCNRSQPDASQAGPAGGPERTALKAVAPVHITTKSGVAMVHLPGGSFIMGSNGGNPDEAPVHKVELPAFSIDKFEVTQEMFAKVQLPNPSHWQDSPRKPVERVRWRDAKRYCNERSLLEGLQPCYDEKTSDWDCSFSANGYRLPTEAEWEYACRAGSTEPYDFGAADKLRQFSWFADNAEQRTHAVGQKKPNRWGIFDMYGNVSEWCEDVFSPTFYKDSPASDPHGPPHPGKDVKRVIRGGSWKSSVDMCSATFRQGERTGDTDACFLTDFCGFRCVRRMSPEELGQLKIAAR